MGAEGVGRREVCCIAFFSCACTVVSSLVLAYGKMFVH